MSRNLVIAGGSVAVFVLIVILSCVYTIYPTDQVLLTELGAPRAVITDSGLHFKVPFLQYANFMPRQLLNLEAPSEEVIAQDKKRLVVDAFARWRIVDPLKFYQAVPYASQEAAEGLLTPILSSNIRRVLGSQSFATVLSEKRDQLMQDIRDNMNQEAHDFGIVVVDVRIKRADLPQANSDAIYQRMQKERQREANEYRAEGDETAQRVRARAEREVTVLIAEATRESDILRGQGDAEKTRILGDAFSRDPDFFAFYRSMQAYKDALKSDNTTLILSPNSEFFRYFGSDGSGEGKRK
ncbi:MAG TPA: protease modulator HflC [Rhizomicrobium sp.]|jgi:membrane protease subunit HflC|nr:protease modulator HflC [Rhizomicrobium sp.]